jgi:hypothetical protein
MTDSIGLGVSEATLQGGTMSVGRFVCFCVVCLAAGAPARAGDSKPPPPTAFRVVAYLPDYRAAKFDSVAARALTDLIVFSAEPTAAGKLDLTRLKNVPWTKLRAFKTRERVRLILCVGGWGRSAYFAAVAGSPDKRRELVKAAVRVCLDERLDGIDLDWEHPKDAAEVDEIDDVYFNGPATIRRKTAFALESGLGGVMAWELGQDAPGDRSLLRVIRSLVDKPRK